MINPFKEINWKPDGTELKKFAVSLIIGFPIIAVVFFIVRWIKLDEGMPEPKFFLLLGGIGAGVGVICWLIKPIARLIYPLWYGLAACIGIVVANLLFMILYFGLFTPMGLFMRLRGRDPLRLKMRKDTASYWEDAPETPPSTQYFKQY